MRENIESTCKGWRRETPAHEGGTTRAWHEIVPLFVLRLKRVMDEERFLL